MLPIIIVDNESVTLQYLPDKRTIYHVIHKPIPEDDVLKAFLDAGTEALKKHGACKWLSDDRKNGPLSPTFLKWSATDWQPRTIAAGWKYWANVVPHEMAAAGTLMPVIDNLYEMGLRMVLFSDLEKAFEWLDKIED
jgi:hypothetical protein